MELFSLQKLTSGKAYGLIGVVVFISMVHRKPERDIICRSTYVNNTNGIEICNNSDWEIYQEAGYVHVKSGALEAKICRARNQDGSTAEDNWRASIENDRFRNSDLKVALTDEIEIDSLEAFLGVIEFNTEGLNQNAKMMTFSIWIHFVHEGFDFSVNCRCYIDDYRPAEKFVRDIAKSLSLFEKKPIKLNTYEKEQLDLFGRELFQAFKYARIEDFTNLFMDRNAYITEAEKYLRDKEVLEDICEIGDEQWESFLSEWHGNIEYSIDRLRDFRYQEGIDWTKIEFERFDYVLFTSMPDIKQARGTLSFKFDDRRYTSELNNLIYLNKRWYLRWSSILPQLKVE